MNNSFVSYKRFTLLAGASLTHNVTGQFFTCKESTAAFQMQMDGGETFAMQVGLSFQLSGDDSFTKLTFINNTAGDITIEYYAGDGEVKDSRLNQVFGGGITVTQTLPATTLQGSATTTIGAGVTITIPGVSGGFNRKQIILANDDLTLNLYVLDSTGALAGIVAPKTSWAVETTDTVKINNPGATPMSIAIGQVYYA